MPSFEVTAREIILREEVEKAMRSMKDAKATGPDGLPAEALKAFDNYNINSITDLCNIIYNSGVIPVEMGRSIVATIPKKPKAKKCRTISLISYITKLLLKVIQQRIVDRIDNDMSQYFYGNRFLPFDSGYLGSYRISLDKLYNKLR